MFGVVFYNMKYAHLSDVRPGLFPGSVCEILWKLAIPPGSELLVVHRLVTDERRAPRAVCSCVFDINQLP